MVELEQKCNQTIKILSNKHIWAFKLFLLQDDSWPEPEIAIRRENSILEHRIEWQNWRIVFRPQLIKSVCPSFNPRVSLELRPYRRSELS